VKVYRSNYRNHWVSPYTILKAVCFWEKNDDVFYNHEDVPGHKYDKWINFLTPICAAWSKFLNFVHPEIKYVKIDRWDTWSMDHTLADIILPMLKQLKETKHGAPFVDDEDVPDELKSTSAPPKENEYDTDDNHFKRWDYVLDEMTFAFECKVDDSWQEKFCSGEHDIKSVPCEWDENGKPKMYKMEKGPNDTYKCDYDGIALIQKRITNGYRLFGKYYEGLWD
jgi:hypothetical protein